jgi:hypothetical protein
VALHHKEAVETVLSMQGSQEIMREHPDVVDSYCLGTFWLKLNGAEYLRYGLADALLRLDYAKGLPSDIGVAAPLAHVEVNDSDFMPPPGKTMSVKQLAVLQEDKEKALALRAASIFAECVARADPDHVLDLVLTEPGSDAEKKAFAALQPPLRSCVPRDRTISLDSLQLRGVLAMNLYRLAKAPRVTPATQP